MNADSHTESRESCTFFPCYKDLLMSQIPSQQPTESPQPQKKYQLSSQEREKQHLPMNVYFQDEI